MNFKHYLGIISVSGFIITSPALAQDGYFGVRGGVSDVHENNITEKYRSNGFGAGYFGLYTGPFRAEIEYTFTPETKFKESPYPFSAQFQRVMGNAYLDMPVTRYIYPYLGGGVGTAFYSVQENTAVLKQTGNNFAWDVTAGIGIKLTRNVVFDSGYRYVDMGTVEMNTKNLDFTAHEAYAGLRFLF